jgi:hypothetical protein
MVEHSPDEGFVYADPAGGIRRLADHVRVARADIDGPVTPGHAALIEAHGRRIEEAFLDGPAAFNGVARAALDETLRQRSTLDTPSTDHPDPSEHDVEAALAVLAAAGWDVRRDVTWGHLIPGTGIVMNHVDASTRTTRWRRTVVQQPWQEGE